MRADDRNSYRHWLIAAALAVGLCYAFSRPLWHGGGVIGGDTDTYSIAHGIGYGFIAYVLIKLLTLRVRDVHPLLGVAAGMFLVYFVFAE